MYNQLLFATIIQQSNYSIATIINIQLLNYNYPLNKIFQHHAHPPAAAATVTISSSSVITSNMNSNKIYVIDSKGSANNVSAAVLTYDYDTECFQTLSNPRKTYVSPKEC